MAKRILITKDPGKDGGMVSWFKKLQKHFLNTNSRVLVVISLRPVDKINEALDVNTPDYLKKNPVQALKVLESAHRAIFAQLTPEEQEELLKPSDPAPIKKSAIITDLSKIKK